MRSAAADRLPACRVRRADQRGTKHVTEKQVVEASSSTKESKAMQSLSVRHNIVHSDNSDINTTRQENHLQFPPDGVLVD